MLALLFQAVDFANTIMEANALASELNVLRLALIAFSALAFLLAIGTGNRVYHGTVAVTWFPLLCSLLCPRVSFALHGRPRTAGLQAARCPKPVNPIPQ